MKVAGFMPLHYGASYLGYAIRSILPSVDELWIAYTPVGSHGSRTATPCPDTRDELFAIAAQAAGDKLRWMEGQWNWEGQQRDMIYQWAADADFILSLDSDEIWPANLAGMVIGQMIASGAHVHRLPMVHFYRDFRHAVLTDMAFPTRAFCNWPKRRAENREVTLSDMPPIAHMGYCIPRELMRYKLSIHGHKGEMRWSPDEYADNIYGNPNRWRDVHPTNVDYWTPVLCEPSIYLPERMLAEHPFAESGAL